MTEAKRRRLRDDSDALLRELKDVRELEEEKRHYRIATPRFRRLADAIERKSREIFVRATDERATGDTLSGPRPSPSMTSIRVGRDPDAPGR